jgi:murein endopeptidase
MPAYKLIVKQQEPLHHNGKIYQQGQTVMDRIVLNEQEAELINFRSEDVRVERLNPDPGVKKVKVEDTEEPKKKTYAQMNAKEREEFKKSKKV